MKKFSVSSNCISCGLCTANSEFLTESSTGEAVPIPGKFISDAELDKANELVNICPAGALSIVEQKSVKNKEDFIKNAISKIQSITDLKEPSEKDFPWNSSEFHVPCYGATGQYCYEYSSNSSANSAAQREFSARAYSQMKPFALNLVMQYKSKYLAPYYVEGAISVYEKKNAEIKMVLTEIAGEFESLFGENFSSNFTKFDVLPDNERNSLLDMLRKDTLFSDEVAERIANKHQSEFPISSYSMYWDTDSEEKYVGKGVFGDKYKTMYCYSGVEKANEAFAKDMLWVAGYIDINLTAYDKAVSLVRLYNASKKKAIEEKISLLKKKQG